MDFTKDPRHQRWIKRLCFFLCAQAVYAAPSCNHTQYFKHKRCCSKCPAGAYVLELCTALSDTRCLPCGPNEYQPDWNIEEKCLPQKFCDKVRGFEPEGPDNRTAAVQCRCLPGFQCHIINCEYCERMTICPPGQEFTSGDFNGHKLNRTRDGFADWSQGSCVKCRHGFFSDVSSATEPCKPWTDCSALGKSEIQGGTDKEDVICGPDFTGASITWLAVVILFFVIAASFFIAFFFFCKDKWKQLSVNVIACVQTLKRRAFQQEALPTHYHSSRGPQNCSLEVTCLIEHEKSPPEFLTASTNDRLAYRDQEPSSEREAKVEAIVGPCIEAPEGSLCPLASHSGLCNCGLSTLEPMELGENEDFSQAVASCTCSGARPRQDPPLFQEVATHYDCTEPRGPCNLCTNVCSQAAENAFSEVSAVEVGNHRDHIQSAVLDLPSVSDNNLCLNNIGLDAREEASGHHLTSGNGNTTFISNGKVLNFSGEVLVVCFSDEFLNEAASPERAVCSPVQEGQGQEKDGT